MPLSEFMPYGAPELLDGAHTRMARATIVASLTVAMLVSVLGAILAHGARTITIVPPDPGFTVTPLPDVFEQHTYQPVPPVPPAAPRGEPDANPIPVPDPLAPRAELTRSGPADSGARDTGRTAPLPNDGIGPLASAGDPEIGKFVVVDVYPELVTGAEPRYPDLARDAGVEGVVRVLMLVGLDGRVARAVVAPGGSVPMLDDAALAAAGSCVFTPALANDHAVKVWVSRSYRFRLH